MLIPRVQCLKKVCTAGADSTISASLTLTPHQRFSVPHAHPTPALQRPSRSPHASASVSLTLTPRQRSCLEHPRDGGACSAATYGVAQSRTRLKPVSSSSSSNIEKVVAPDSNTLAWKIPWMEEPGRLQSMGSLRVGHD